MTRAVLLVAHGQPAAPATGAQDLARVADAVAALLPDWHIGAATLAAPDALARAVRSLPAAGSDPLVLPFFISDGWFTRNLLPRRLAEAGAAHLRALPAFGLWPATAALATTILTEACADRGWAPADTVALLAAHGSASGPAAALAARLIRDRIAGQARFAALPVGFIEETPLLRDAATGLGRQSLCLPLFVARWGHVRDDIPAALREAAFAGALLDPLGCDPRAPQLLAEALRGA